MLVHIVLWMLLQLDKAVVRGGGGEEKMTYLVSLFYLCVFQREIGLGSRRRGLNYSINSGWYSNTDII